MKPDKLKGHVALDLGRLAVMRCDQAYQSVAQLLEGPEAYGLAMLMAAHFVEVASQNLQDGMEQQNGAKPPFGPCLSHTISEVLDALEVPHEIAEAKK